MSWSTILKEESQKDYFKAIISQVQNDAKQYEVYPPHKDLFAAFKLCPFSQTKVVILGQDPYHGPGQAEGLSFSVPKGVEIPPSLRNIQKELIDDLGIYPPGHGHLSGWAKEGVLLLNTFLTVRKSQAASHKSFGWESFTDQIISILDKQPTPIVFILWGGFARKKKKLIQNQMVIESAHPSPLSAYNGFFGSKPFSRANDLLIDKGSSSIDWGRFE